MRILLLVILAFIAQSFLSGLLGEVLSPPDLIYLATLIAIGSVSPYAGLPLAFGIGLVQDLLSAGYPGLHAVGLLFAAYAYYRLTRLVHWDELAGKIVVLVGSFLAKWLGYLLIAVWLKMGGFNPLTLWPVMVVEMVLTLLIAPWVIGSYQRVFGVVRRRE
ncbi:MAG: rod shape-determining protein MreD [Thermaceae bacterium]|nr:rod shape-determining protein MreD [Thermaceae bacterium]